MSFRSSCGGLLVALELMCCSPMAWACFRLNAPTPEELVRRTELIVRARAERYLDGYLLEGPPEESLERLEDYLAVSSVEGSITFGARRSWLAHHLACILRPCSGWRLVQFTVLEVVKGGDDPGVLHVVANESEFQGANRGRVPYTAARPGADGLCYALDYRIGREYLLFLQEGQLYFEPGMPINEEVDGADDPWVVWVRSRR